ncbi:M23 family metallopeptidase [Nonomuraea lactucae]|uniref:M23 family metallopeptidase n=1 Tax=Nonomuraea lactucae TaxID=2249762 RepID=UPI001F056542|nr:M23 family metallopeptidase [Nonomuraea lactucae]
MAGALLVTGACSQPTGVAGVSAESPVSVPPPGATPVVTATIPEQAPSQGAPPQETPSQETPSQEPMSQQAPSEQVSVEPPEGAAPVKVPPPKLSGHSYTFPVRGCRVSYQRRLLVLPKTTIWTGEGCAFVAPVSGVVDEVNPRNRWLPSTDRGPDREGRFVTIIGDDGVRYLGGHLDSIAGGVRPGARVGAGQLLGRVGRSGNARSTGPNLYFAISWKAGPRYWWVRRGTVNPWSYLDAWLSGNRTLSPRDETMALRSRLGETPRCSVLCKPKKAPRAQPERDDGQPPVTITLSPS